MRRHDDPMDLVNLAQSVMKADQFVRATTHGKLTVVVDQIRALQSMVCGHAVVVLIRSWVDGWVFASLMSLVNSIQNYFAMITAHAATSTLASLSLDSRDSYMYESRLTNQGSIQWGEREAGGKLKLPSFPSKPRKLLPPKVVCFGDWKGGKKTIKLICGPQYFQKKET